MTMPTKSVAMEEMRCALYRYCLSLTSSTWDAEDLVQETCLRALPVINGTLQHPNPTAYLLRTAKNIAIDQARRKNAADRMLEVMKRNEAVLSRLYEEAPELDNVLRLLIRHLSPLQRTVFLLKELFGYKNAEVAGKLATSEGAVKAALHRARTTIDKWRNRELASIRFGGSRFDRRDQTRTGEKGKTGFSSDETALLGAYVNAIRQENPQALITLANAEAGIVDVVQAVGQFHNFNLFQSHERINAFHPSQTNGGNQVSSGTDSFVRMQFAA